MFPEVVFGKHCLHSSQKHFVDFHLCSCLRDFRLFSDCQWEHLQLLHIGFNFAQILLLYSVYNTFI